MVVYKIYFSIYILFSPEIWFGGTFFNMIWIFSETQAWHNIFLGNALRCMQGIKTFQKVSAYDVLK